LNQAGLLLTIYEEGNGLGEVAYQSIGDCPRTGYIMGLDKTLCQRGPQSGAEKIAFDTHKHVWLVKSSSFRTWVNLKISMKN
jgi:hypothetical protein